MARALKNMYNPAFFESLCPILEENIQGFECSYFIHRVFNNHWPELESKQRVAHIARVLNDFLPQRFEEACKILIQVSDCFRYNNREVYSLALIVISEWLRLFGANHPELSLAALGKIAELMSTEFALNSSELAGLTSGAFQFQFESFDN